jgi:hypothetical protein
MKARRTRDRRPEPWTWAERRPKTGVRAYWRPEAATRAARPIAKSRTIEATTWPKPWPSAAKSCASAHLHLLDQGHLLFDERGLSDEGRRLNSVAGDVRQS